MRDALGMPSKVSTRPSMVEKEFISVSPYITAREHESNGLRDPFDKEGNFNGSYYAHPNEKLCGYTLNNKGKVVRFWVNRYDDRPFEQGTIPKGDYVAESVYIDSIDLNKETRSLYER
jgi:hypothetical protein